MKHDHITLPKLSYFSVFEKLKHLNHKLWMDASFSNSVAICSVVDKNTPNSFNYDIDIKPLLNTKLHTLNTIFLLLEPVKNGFKIDLTKYVSLTSVTGYILMDNKLKIYEYCCNGNIYKNNCQENNDSSIIRNSLFHTFNYFIHTKSHAIVYSISSLLLKTLDSKNYIHKLFNEFLYNDVVVQNDIYGIDLAVFADKSIIKSLRPDLTSSYMKMIHLVDLTDTSNFNNKIQIIINNLKCKKYAKKLKKLQQLFVASQNFSEKYSRYVIKKFTNPQIEETEDFLNEAIRICKNSNIDNIPNSSDTLLKKLSYIIGLIINQTFIHHFSNIDFTNDCLMPSIYGSILHYNYVSTFMSLFRSYNEKIEHVNDKSHRLLKNKIFYKEEDLNKIMNSFYKKIEKLDEKINLTFN
jgi:hypothetical protein